MLFLNGMSLFTVATNIISGLSFSFNYKWLFISLFTIVLLICKSKGIVSPAILHRIGIYFLSLFVLPMGWLSSSGLVSPSITYSFLVLIMVNTLTRGRERLFLNAGQIFLALCLICLFYYHPTVFKPMNQAHQFLDWIINVPIVLAFAALLLTTFEKAYEAERLDNQSHRAMLEKTSVTDSLTGVFNRTRMKDEIERSISIFNRTTQKFCLLMIDIDHFKSFNDACGHQQGDSCLRQVARILKQSVSRNTDSIFRYGGEEFLIVLGHTGINGGNTIAGKIQQNLKNAAIHHPGTNEMLTISVGIAEVGPDNRTADEILFQADQALYLAKKAGRNRIKVFTPMLEGTAQA